MQKKQTYIFLYYTYSKKVSPQNLVIVKLDTGKVKGI